MIIIILDDGCCVHYFKLEMEAMWNKLVNIPFLLKQLLIKQIFTKGLPLLSNILSVKGNKFYSLNLSFHNLYVFSHIRNGKCIIKEEKLRKKFPFINPLN